MNSNPSNSCWVDQSGRLTGRLTLLSLEPRWWKLNIGSYIVLRFFLISRVSVGIYKMERQPQPHWSLACLYLTFSCDSLSYVSDLKDSSYSQYININMLNTMKLWTSAQSGCGKLIVYLWCCFGSRQSQKNGTTCCGLWSARGIFECFTRP